MINTAFDFRRCSLIKGRKPQLGFLTEGDLVDVDGAQAHFDFQVGVVRHAA